MSNMKAACRTICTGLLLCALAACGGGEGAGAAGGGSGQLQSGAAAAAPQQNEQPLSVQFGSCALDTPVRIHLSDVVRVSAIVRGADGSARPDVLVSFTAPVNAALAPALGTALTNAGGTASVQLQPTALGAAALTVSATVDGTQRSTSLAFDVVSQGAARTTCALN